MPAGEPGKSEGRQGAPRPGSLKMPRWGPGLFMAGAAIGGGEWLTGPLVTTQYGGGLLWLATLI